ncbi:MAG: NAD(+)/NADH kinase [Acidobacteria bacterium]|nr:NAD(+)/NADH kinase [Acidobacteriota bacterium]
MRKVAIISKPQKPELATLLPELIHWLGAHQLEAVLDPISGSYIGEGECCDRAQLIGHNPELVIVLGGDGTLLAAARAFAKTDIPILSVNLGSLGFLTEVPLSQLYITLEGWLEGRSGLDERGMMHARLVRDGKIIHEWDALNDVVISKGAIARMGDYNIHLDRQLVAQFRADGIIVATPTGSTAYNLSANGPIVMSSVDALIVTPICPHLLTIRPIVVPGGAEISVCVTGIADQTYLTVDGQEAVELQLNDELNCGRSPYRVRMVRLGEHGLFGVLRSKLKWGQR